MLAKHFGDIVKAARELNVNRTDLRKLTWHNPRILKASHERMELFRIGVKSKILEAIYSPSAKRRRWGTTPSVIRTSFATACLPVLGCLRRRHVSDLRRLRRLSMPSLFWSKGLRLSLSGRLRPIASGSLSSRGLRRLRLRLLVGARSGLSLLGDRRSWRLRAALYGRRILGVLQEGDVDRLGLRILAGQMDRCGLLVT